MGTHHVLVTMVALNCMGIQIIHYCVCIHYTIDCLAIKPITLYMQSQIVFPWEACISVYTY